MIRRGRHIKNSKPATTKEP